MHDARLARGTHVDAHDDVAVFESRRAQEGVAFVGPGCLLETWMADQPQECKDYWDGLCTDAVVVPEGVTEIPVEAFFLCYNLTTIAHYYSSLTTIERRN